MLDVAHHLVLPVVTLVAVVYAQYLLVMRSSLLDEMGSDYLTTARAKGLRDDLVRRRHAVPNALLPTVTLIFLHLGGMVAGAIMVETVFSWPGLGRLFYEALERARPAAAAGHVHRSSPAAVIVMNLLADLVYPVLDPRVRPMSTRTASAARRLAWAVAAHRRRSGASTAATAPGLVGLAVLVRSSCCSRCSRRSFISAEAELGVTARRAPCSSRRAASSRSAPTSPAGRCWT